jgi:hypothetical protein
MREILKENTGNNIQFKDFQEMQRFLGYRDMLVKQNKDKLHNYLMDIKAFEQKYVYESIPGDPYASMGKGFYTYNYLQKMQESWGQ